MEKQFRDRKKIESNLQKWILDVSKSDNSWEANNLHIDEIEVFKNIKRSKWIEDSFFVFEILISQIKLLKQPVLFLHIELLHVETKPIQFEVSFKWIENNLDDFTPPSFNCTSLEYYNDFYRRNTTKCDVDKSISNLIGNMKNINFSFRTYFDESENMYSRELYVFYIRG